MLTEVEKDAFSTFLDVLDRFGTPYYLHAGIALHIHGLEGDLEDCDVRVLLPSSQLHLLEEYFGLNCVCVTRILGTRKFSGGYYLNNCLQVWVQNTRFDICGEMVTSCKDLGEIRFPFGQEVFRSVLWKEYHGVKAPVINLEDLLIYYLIHRRGADEGKDDIKHIYDVVAHKDFDHRRFYEHIAGYSESGKLIRLFNTIVGPVSGLEEGRASLLHRV